MPPLRERQPDAASAGAHSAHTDDAQLTPSPTPGAQDNAAKAAPARSRRRPGGDDAAGSAREGAFVCRTCSRRFPSFQALGGHRTGHTRLQARRALPLQQQKPARAAHECAVCGLEFAMGQALGGHMRRHKNDDAQALVEVEGEAGKQQAQAQARVEEEKQRGEEEANCAPPLEDRCGGDREGCSSGSGSEPRLLNLLV